MSDQALSGREASRDLELKAAAELERVPGVLAAAVWIGEAPHVREVYIAAAPGTSVPELKRTSCDVLRASGLICSPDSIQIGVLDSGTEPPPAGGTAAPRPEPPRSPSQPQEPALAPEEAVVPAWHGRFLVFVGLDVRRAEHHVTCRVQLLRVGEVLTGEARELDTPAGRARAAARATLQAVADAARGTALALEGALILDLFGRQYVAVSVEAASARRTNLLSGLVVVERSIEDAACFATLSAIERWLAW